MTHTHSKENTTTCNTTSKVSDPWGSFRPDLCPPPTVLASCAIPPQNAPLAYVVPHRVDYGYFVPPLHFASLNRLWAPKIPTEPSYTNRDAARLRLQQQLPTGPSCDNFTTLVHTLVQLRCALLVGGQIRHGLVQPKPGLLHCLAAPPTNTHILAPTLLSLLASSIGPPLLLRSLLFVLARVLTDFGALSVSHAHLLSSSTIHTQTNSLSFHWAGGGGGIAHGCLSHVMASSSQPNLDKHAHVTILSPAPVQSTRSAAYRNPPRWRAPDSDYYSCTAIPEDPPSTFASSPSAESYLLRNAVADFPTADPLVRRYREARALPRVFADSRHYTSRHVTSSQPWPPRRDSLNAPIPGVR